MAVAAKGREAIQLLASSTYDVVIGDVGMSGGISGVDLAELVEKRYPQTQVIQAFSAEGNEICNASGGFTGGGDGKCPESMGRGTKTALIWSHPASTSQTDEPPGLMRN